MPQLIKGIFSKIHLVAKEDSLKDLVGVAFNQHWVHHFSGRDRRVEVLLEVHGQELEYQVQPEKWLPRCRIKQNANVRLTK
jgi:hypothetical protein